MKKQRTRRIALMLVFVMCFALLATSCGKKNEEVPGNEAQKIIAAHKAEEDEE